MVQDNDLISRAAAIDALTDTNLRRNVDSVCDGDMNRTRRAAQRVIAQLPAVDAVSVRHGRWVPHPTEPLFDVCSACGTGCKRRENDDGAELEYSYRYCPYCGATLDGER